MSVVRGMQVNTPVPGAGGLSMPVVDVGGIDPQIARAIDVGGTAAGGALAGAGGGVQSMRWDRSAPAIGWFEGGYGGGGGGGGGAGWAPAGRPPFEPLTDWDEVRGQITQAEGPGDWAGHEETIRGFFAPGPEAFDPRLRGIIGGDVRFSDAYADEIAAQRAQYFGPEGLIPALRQRWGEGPGGTRFTSGPAGGGYGALRGEFQPGVDAALAELGTGEGTTLGRLTDLYGVAMSDLSGLDPAAYGARRRADAMAGVDARTQAAIARTGATRQGLRAALEAQGALAASAAGALGQTQGEVAGREMRGAALDRALGAAAGIGTHRLGAAGSLGDLLAQREAAFNEGRQTDLQVGSDITGQWRQALADWGNTYGGYVSADLNAFNTAVGAKTAWDQTKAAIDRANAAMLGTGYQGWMDEMGQTNRFNADALNQAWTTVFQGNNALRRGRDSIMGNLAGINARARNQALRDAQDRAERDRNRPPRYVGRDIVSRPDPNRTGVFGFGP